MGVNYAVREEKTAKLSTDFAREFVTKHFGALAAEKIYAALPRYKRGALKGQPKGWVIWTKCVKGGWVRKGGYDHDAQQGNGYVMTPGTHDVRIILTHPAYAENRSLTLDAGDRRGFATDPNCETDEQWATRCARAIYQLSGQPVPAELAESPAPELCYPLANDPATIVTHAFGHWFATVRAAGRIPAMNQEGTDEYAAVILWHELLNRTRGLTWNAIPLETDR